MRKKLGYILIGLGAALIISALLLLIYNQWENKQAKESSESMLADVQTAIQEQAAIETPSLPEEPAKTDEKTEEEVEETEPTPTKIAMINGYNYIGILNLPGLMLELPVLSDCDEVLLKIAPCRDYGDLSTNDLVIAAHNYRNHFGRLSQLKNGDEVTFTDMDGVVHHYQIEKSMMIGAGDVVLVVDSGYELVLYTCDYTNQNRIAVYCKKVTA